MVLNHKKMADADVRLDCEIKLNNSLKDSDNLFNDNFSVDIRENDDMTENSDSGFTEINQSRSTESSPKGDSSSSPVPSEKSEVKIAPEGNPPANLIPQSSTNENNCPSEDDDTDDDDYDDSDTGKPDILSWVRQQMMKGANPRDVVKLILHNFHIPEDINEAMLWRIISFAVQPQRERLNHVRSLHDAVQQIKQAKNIIVLTGAGVSVSCGIPDFRSRDGIYSRLSREYPNLPDPQAMFDIKFFSQDPRPFFKFAREIFPGQFKPSPSHRFIRKLEERNVLLRNYTQNIDTLERVAGISRLIECHGSFATASCTRCKFKINGDAIREDILQQRIPICFKCNPENHASLSLSTTLDESPASEQLATAVEMGIFKPDIVFFGEELPDDFHNSIDIDRSKCDLLIVIGSSLKVKPVAMIPNLVQPNIPQILINREPLTHMNFDINLFGDSDVIVNHLYKMIDETDNDEELCWMETPLIESTIDIPPKDESKSEESTASTTKATAVETETSEEREVENSAQEQTTSSSRENESLVKLLPENSFAQISPRCYLFPGAEVTMENLDGGESDDSDGEFSEDDDEEENEESPANAEIIVPDIDNGLSNDQVPVPESSPTLVTASSLSPLSSSQLHCNDREIVENISDIQANDATASGSNATVDDGLEPSNKRIRLEETGEKIF